MSSLLPLLPFLAEWDYVKPEVDSHYSGAKRRRRHDARSVGPFEHEEPSDDERYQIEAGYNQRCCDECRDPRCQQHRFCGRCRCVRLGSHCVIVHVPVMRPS